MITICLATYNGEKYLQEQLLSLKHQTYKNFKIIAQDDCSSDSSVQILNSFQETENIQIDIYKNAQNLGYIKNFESLLKKTDSEYIAICDQDDIWEANKLEILMANIKDKSLIYSDSLLINKNGNSLEKKLSEKLKNNFISSKTALNFLYDNSVSAHAILFKKELLSTLFPFPDHLYFDAWIAANAANLSGVCFLNEALVKYRQHDSNTLAHTKKKKLNFTQKLNKKVLKKETDVENILLKIDELINLKNLKEEEVSLLKTLKLFYLDFNNRYFNIKMFFFFLKHRNILFPITKKNNFLLSLKKSIGKKLYSIAPFL